MQVLYEITGVQFPPARRAMPPPLMPQREFVQCPPPFAGQIKVKLRIRAVVFRLLLVASLIYIHLEASECELTVIFTLIIPFHRSTIQ